MAKSKDSGWLSESRKIFGHSSGGGASKKGGKGDGAGKEFSRGGKDNGGVDGPTKFGAKSGGSKQPRGKDRPQQHAKGINGQSWSKH